MKFTFVPELEEIGRVNPIADRREFSNERSLFSAGLDKTARMKDAPLLDRIMSNYGLNNDVILGNAIRRGLYPTVDMRVQRLMPGMFPSIPGWHCDDVPRDSYHSQPDLSKISGNVRHYTCLLSTSMDVSNTEFVCEPLELDVDPTKGSIWQQVHRQVEVIKPRTIQVEPGVIYRFNQTSIHRARSCKERGWRIFFRLSLRSRPPRNVEPSEMQVYVLSEENGW